MGKQQAYRLRLLYRLVSLQKVTEGLQNKTRNSSTLTDEGLGYVLDLQNRTIAWGSGKLDTFIGTSPIGFTVWVLGLVKYMTGLRKDGRETRLAELIESKYGYPILLENKQLPWFCCTGRGSRTGVFRFAGIGAVRK